MSTKFFIMTHVEIDTHLNNPGYIPIHVGSEGNESLGYLADNTLDEISYKNPTFGELTGLYWLWKNYHGIDNIGICHYRRFFYFNNRLMTEEKAEELLSNYDAITYVCGFSKDVKAHYQRKHHIKDLYIIEKIIRDSYPKYYDHFINVMNGKSAYLCNLMITNKKLYNDYCKWLFDILFELECRADTRHYSKYQKRLPDYMAERLQKVWFDFHKLSVYAGDVIIGEQRERRW